MADFRRHVKSNHKVVPYLEQLIADDDSVSGFHFEYEAKKSDDAFHPSGDCDSSVAELVGKIDGTGEVKDWSGMNKTFMVGHFWHAYLQHILVYGELATPDAIEANHKMYWGERPYEWATGSADVAPCLIPDHGPAVVDFKTMGSFQYKPNKVPDWAAVKYEAQLNVYMEWFNLESGIIIAVNKDSPHEMKEYEYARNQDLIDAIFAKWELAGEAHYDGSEISQDDEDALSLAQYCKGPIAQ